MDLVLSLLIVGVPVLVLWRARVLHRREIATFEQAEAARLEQRRADLADQAFFEAAHRRMTRRREHQAQAARFRRVG